VTGELVFDSNQAAAILRCSTKTVEERARSGDLPGLKYGDGWVFPVQAFYERLNELAREQAAERRKGTGKPAPAAVATTTQQPTKRRPPPLPSLVR
jgi:hypothetical protein